MSNPIKYTVRFSQKAEKQLKKLDKQVFFLITKWINKNLVSCENPRLHGKILKGKLSDYWRYRVGDYRIITQIQDKEVTILVVNIAHRSVVYD